ncbi:MAG: T9SS type A sorting domain-containing protein [Candidatus Cloacimonetes bacterium]|nr:T9SS type A sorting domain-containing protein [Candidatus Cloacimonadota bacterium]
MKRFSIFVLMIIAVSAIFATTIYDVQYTTVPGADNTYPSTMTGQEVTVEGIVTGIGISGYEDNFYISMPEGGAWCGIYVYAAQDSSRALGDLVSVTCTVAEYYGLTELSFPTDVTLISAGNPLPPPVVVTTLDVSGNEAYEGVLVELQDVYVSAVQDGYGQWYVVDMSGTPCQIDDTFFYLDSVDPPIEVIQNDYWAFIRGIATYSFDEYQIDPRFPEDMSHVSAIGENSINPVSSLNGNYPNPFNPETVIDYNLVDNAYVEIGIYNVKGEKVNSLVNSNQAAGNHQAVWTGIDLNGNTVTSGVYFYMLNGDSASMQKMILLK